MTKVTLALLLGAFTASAWWAFARFVDHDIAPALAIAGAIGVVITTYTVVDESIKSKNL